MGGGRSSLGRLRNGGSGQTKFTDFGAYDEALKKSSKFFSENSNSDTWSKGELTGNEHDAIEWYTGNGFTSINKAMYTTKYEDMSPSMKNTVDNIESGMNKFVLTKGIQVTRACDFKIFGAKSGERMSIQQIKDYIKANSTKGVLQNDGFLSSGANNHGAAIDGDGLVIHFKVPPSKGAGAYVNPISLHAGSGENEFLFNSKSQFKFDISSLRVDSMGKIHINATWVGRGRKQSFVK